jgi:DNA-binding response OmpR family regulator
MMESTGRQVTPAMDEILERVARETLHASPIEGRTKVLIDLGQREFVTGAGVVPLTSTEFDVVAYLGIHSRKPVDRLAILRALYRGSSGRTETRAVDVLNCRIRKKLGPDGRNMIRAIPNRGYYFTPEVSLIGWRYDAP